jgi:hypothetical protein
MGFVHTTIPHMNYLLTLMGKYTGAFTPSFSNDLELLKYPKIKEFDAIFLNSTCGMIYNDPEVRAGLLRFVQEGGGIGGNHCVTFANNNWPEFAELMGGWAGAHHVEKQFIKVDDPNSPLTKSFGSTSFEHTDEFYIFPPYSPYSREKQHEQSHVRALHAPRSGLRSGVDQDVRQGTRLLQCAGPHRRQLHRPALYKSPAGGDSVHSRRPRC